MASSSRIACHSSMAQNGNDSIQDLSDVYLAHCGGSGAVEDGEGACPFELSFLFSVVVGLFSPTLVVCRSPVTK